MIKEYTIIDEAGLHARPASLLVRAASKFPYDINIEYEGKKISLKTIMGVMSLGVPKGGVIRIEVLNDDVEDCYDSLENILLEHQLIER